MIIVTAERRRRRRIPATCVLAALAVLAAALPGEGRSQQPPFTLAQLLDMRGVTDFPYVLGGGPTIRVERVLYDGKTYAIGDGSQQAKLFIFRATNCFSLKKSTIDCSGSTGPGVFIPVLWVTPASKPRQGKSFPPDLTFKFGPRGTNSLASYVIELQDNTKANWFWIRLSNPRAGSLNELDELALPAALVLCVPSTECQNPGIQLTNLAEDADEATAPARPAAESRPPDGGPRPAAGAAGPGPAGPGLTGPGLTGPGTASPRPAGSSIAGPGAAIPGPAGPATVPAGPQAAPERTGGRWLLGLYGPQNIGSGIDASAGAIADARDEILAAMTKFLDDYHAQTYRSRSADLVLMTSSGAASPALPQENVLNGTSRRPPPDSTGRFQLDREGDRRLAAFLSGPSSSGAEASFKSVGDMIKGYAKSIGDSASQRPPLAVYVGAARPLPASCAAWKKMTADVAALPGRPRVLGVVFANVSAGQIDQQLGRNERGEPEPLAGRTRTPTCNGDGDSALLWVPFTDLISHTPESVLAQAFAAIRRRADKLQN
jgi:hypothetical protein